MKQAHTENKDEASDIKVDSKGNYVLLGYFDVNDSLTHKLNYETLEIPSHGERDIFVIKMDSDGNPLWGINGGGRENDYAGGLALDEDDNIYFNGYYDDSTGVFGDTELTCVEGKEVVIAKLDSLGTYQWAVSASGTGDDLGTSIEYINDSGLLLVTGYFEETISVDGSDEEFVSAGNDDLFVFTITEDGNYDNGYTFGGTEEDQGEAISYVQGSDGDYYVSGTIRSDMNLPDNSVTNYGYRDMLVLRMKHENLVWAKSYGGSNHDDINASAIDNNGNVFFAGTFKSTTAEFGTETLTSFGEFDLWIGQMHEPTPFSAPVILAISDIQDDQGGKVRIEFTGSELASSFTVWRQIDTTSEWDALGSFDGIYKNRYSYVAETLGDSTMSGIHWSIFKVSAHEENIYKTFYVSDPDTGYSIDNLAPVVPGGIIADGFDEIVQLAWDENIDKDFQYYAIYRSLDPEFTADTMNTYTYTTSDNFFGDDDVIQGNTYYYSIAAVDYSGNYSESSEKVYALVNDVDSDLEIPKVYELGQNYPNPFNPSTVIKFSLPESRLVSLKVFNILGEEVATLVNEMRSVGNYEVSFDASNLTTGMYIYRIQSGEFTSTKKMMLIK
ncbi:MAG: T9SS type A sorting domain-containing protein [Melioribacteraceae bacterium]|nr:T9SS type A sorting domain-containing protein [Melioribacteraceae bacterium]